MMTMNDDRQSIFTSNARQTESEEKKNKRNELMRKQNMNMSVHVQAQ